MRPYGARRQETLSCRWGCCGRALRRANRGTLGSHAAARAARRRARRDARREALLKARE
jgi:hypothetical protein